jgi:hypothetical protein
MLNRPSSEPQAFHTGLRLSLCALLLLAILFPHVLCAQDIAQVKKGVVKITAQVEGKNQIGSGIIVKLDEDHAYIVTASHVIEGDPQPNVMFFSAPHRPFRTRVLGLEGGNPTGLAALLIEGKLPPDLQALNLDQTTSIGGGEAITLIGFPRLEGSLWTVTTGTLSGRRGSTLSFAGVADEGNSGGPVLFQGKVVGIVTQVGAKFNSAAPAMLARFALEGWGVRLSEEAKTPPPDAVKKASKPIPTAPAVQAPQVTGNYQGRVFFSVGGMVILHTTYQQHGETVSGSYADDHGDFGAVQGRAQGTVFEGRTASQAFQNVRCDFSSEVGGGGKTIQGNFACNNSNSGSFTLERQE